MYYNIQISKKIKPFNTGFSFPFIMLYQILTGSLADFITHKGVKLTDISVASSFDMVGESLLEASCTNEQKKAA